MICKKCGNSMKLVDDGVSIGWICESCGEGYITTYDNPINSDENIYEIILLSHYKVSKEQLKFISKINNSNYIQTKKDLIKGNVVLKKGLAKEIKDILIQLKNLEISFTVSPEFPYQY